MRLETRALIAVPRIARDLEGHALVAHHLERRHGITTRLTDINGLEQGLLEWSPDVLVLDYLAWDARARLAVFAKSLNVRIVLLPIAGLFEDDRDFARTAGKDTGGNVAVDRFLAWGDLSRRALIAHSALPSEKIHVVGCSRFDLYSEPYLRLASPRRDFLASLEVSDPSSPIFVWATNTPHRHQGDAARVAHRVIHDGLSEEDVRAEIEDEREQFEQHSRIVLALASRHRDWTFVVRVHPIEDARDYVERTAGAPNVRVTFEGPIRDLLVHCQGLLQRSCTTASEAWMLNKPVLELSIGSYKRQWAPLQYREGNRRVESLEDTERALLEVLAGAPIARAELAARDAFLQDAYFRIDGRSAQRCAEAIAELVEAPAYDERERMRTRDRVREALTNRARREDARMTNRFKDALGIARSTSLRPWKRWGQTSRGAAALRATHGEIPDSVVREIFQRYDGLFPPAPTPARTGTSSGSN